MVTGTADIDFILHDCRTLKEKRSVVKSLIARTQNSFKISIAEIDFLDLCKRGRIGFAVVSNDRRYANSVIDKVINFIENLQLVDIIDVNVNLF